MRLKRLVLLFAISLFAVTSAAHAQSGATTANQVNPSTGPSFPCPQPKDPLAQLICSTPELSVLDMQFVQSYEALYQQAGATGQPAVRQMDIESELSIRAKCGIALAQPSESSISPPPAPPGADMCVLAAYETQIAQWKSMLQGEAFEEANRSVPEQVALQTRLQALGFLPVKAQMDGVFGSGTRSAIKQWQLSVGRQPTGLLGDLDAQALLGTLASAANSGSSPTVPLGSQLRSSATQAQAQADVGAVLPPSQPSGPEIVPTYFQGVWSPDCTGAVNATAPYIVFGPSLLLRNYPGSGPSTDEVVQFVQTENGFAISEDTAYTSKNGAEPKINIGVYQIVSADEISPFSTFNISQGIAPGGGFNNKCSPNTAFSNSVSQVSSFVAPTAVELSASQTAFSQMPLTKGTKWNPR